MGLLRKPLPVDAGDIVIAPDASYVETSSAPCAIELKRRYDALYGVNVNVRSPYAITAFVGQHGQTRFRVGLVPLLFVYFFPTNLSSVTETCQHQARQLHRLWIAWLCRKPQWAPISRRRRVPHRRRLPNPNHLKLLHQEDPNPLVSGC